LLDQAAAIDKSVRKENDAWLAYYQAAHSAIRGDRDGAIQLLKGASELGFADNLISNDPLLASIRGDPEFEALEAAVKKRVLAGK
jgi:hypothetical protein